MSHVKYKISDEFKIEVRNHYLNSKKSIREIAEIYKVTRYYIYKVLEEQSINLNRVKTYSFDYNYFDVIDTEEKAYFLGLFYSDGTNNQKRNSSAIELQHGDVDILNKLNIAMKSNHPLLYNDPRHRRPNEQPTYKAIFYSKYFCSQLTKLGCVPRKSLILKFPTPNQVPKYLLRHFIRGYYDGNGGCGAYIQNKKYYLRCGIRASRLFCSELTTFLSKELDITYSISKDSESNKIQFFGKNANIFLSWLYKNTNLFLERKYLKYNQSLNMIESRDSI